MTKKAKLPGNLKHSKCERGDLTKQGGGLPPTCFIHLKANSDTEVATVAIDMLREVKEEFSKYSGVNIELTVMHI